MRTGRVRLLLLGLALSLVSGAFAAEFCLTEEGAKPRSFRISALRRGSETAFVPSIFKRSLLNRTGKSIQDTPGNLRLGQQDGKLFLLIETEYQSGQYWAIGDASDLDQIRLDPGIEFSGKKVWDTGARIWRTQSNRSQWGRLPLFQGSLLDRNWARDQLLEALSKGEGLVEGSLKVVASVLTQSWRDTLEDEGGGSGAGSLESYLVRARDFYLAPMRQAFREADTAGRKRLLRFHKAMIKAAKACRRRLAKEEWRTQVCIQVFEGVVVELDSLAQEMKELLRTESD